MPNWPRLAAVQAPGRHFNVKDAGAKGDGQSDDGPILQKLFAKLPKGNGQLTSDSGGTIYLPAGRYATNKSLVIENGVNLAGEHTGQVEIVGGPDIAGPVLHVKGTQVRIENITFHGAKTGILWQGGVGSQMLNCRIESDNLPLHVLPNAMGRFHNVTVSASMHGVVLDEPDFITLSAVSVDGSSRGAFLVKGGGEVTLEGCHYSGPGTAVTVRSGASVAVIGMHVAGKGPRAIFCDEESLIYISALHAPDREVSLLDRRGGLKVSKPDLSLYTGQATVLSGPRNELEPPREFVRINCGGGRQGAFDSDTGFTESSHSYGFDIDPLEIDFNHLKTEPAPPPVYLTERSGDSVQYAFAMQPGMYTVKLHCCEVFFTKAGRRPFKVDINARTLAERVDVLAKTGDTKFAPVVFTYKGVKPDADGRVTIFLDGLIVEDLQKVKGPKEHWVHSKTSRGRPTISALEIIPEAGGTE